MPGCLKFASVSNTRYGIYIFNTLDAKSTNCIFALNGNFQSLVQLSGADATFDNCVFYGNSAVSSSSLATTRIYNSIIRASGAGKYILSSDSDGIYETDYNLYFPESGSTLAKLNSFLAVNLFDYQLSKSDSFHSIVTDPLFHNPGALDFHLESAFGRFEVGSGYVTNDLQTSPAIDYGDPDSAFGQETTPNGLRINVGAYGETDEASLSSTNPSLLAITLNDGGTVSGTTTVYWVHSNMDPTNTVDVEFSLDAGENWTAIASSLPVTNSSAVWDTTADSSSARSLWRVSMVTDTSVVDQIDQLITIHNSNLVFYVNDSSTNLDVYTTAPGAVTNSGTSADSPLLDLADIFVLYDINRGDTVFIDTGSYTVTNTIEITASDGGGSGTLTIIGSTNSLGGSSVLTQTSAAEVVMEISDAPDIHILCLTFADGVDGLNISDSGTVLIEDSIFSDNGEGLVIFDCVDVDLANLVLEGSVDANLSVQFSSDVNANHITSVGPRGVSVSNTSGLNISNSIIFANGPAATYAYVTANAGTIRGDYNVLLHSGAGDVAKLAGTIYPTLSDFQNATGRELHSIARNPDLANNSVDFHPKSLTGRLSGGVYVTDVVHSAAIDLADPAFSFGDEALPNGDRANSGAYGNTAESSLSQTNEWLVALTYNDGGTLNAPGDVVYWNAGGYATGATVRIELSRNSGVSWDIIETNLLALTGSYTWVNTNFPSSRFSLWRVVYEANTNILDAISTDIVYRNGNFVYYVNDASQSGDVYTDAVGSDGNLGITAAEPKAHLKSILDAYQLQAGDEVFIDTGAYNLPQNTTISQLDSGDTNAMVFLIGSTNISGGGTILSRLSTSSSSLGLDFDNASYVKVTDLIVRNAGEGIRLTESSFVELDRVTVKETSTHAVRLTDSDNDYP